MKYSNDAGTTKTYNVKLSVSFEISADSENAVHSLFHGFRTKLNQIDEDFDVKEWIVVFQELKIDVSKALDKFSTKV